MFLMFHIEVTGHKELQRTLRRIAEPKLMVKHVRRELRLMAKPFLAEVQQRTPAETGRLRSSMGIAAAVDRQGGEISVVIGPRRTFRYTNAAGTRMVVAYTDKQRQSAAAKGITEDRTKPVSYAHGIEFGVDSAGRLRRREGGAEMIGGSLDAMASSLAAEMPGRLLEAVRTAAIEVAPVPKRGRN